MTAFGEQVVALLDHPVPQLLHVGHQGAVLPAGEVEVLVAPEQVAERLCRQQHLEGVEIAPLVDIHQPALQHRAPFGQVVLRQHQLARGAVHLARQAVDLALQLGHDAVGGLPLAFEVLQLVLHIMHLPLQPLTLPLQLLPLRLDLLQPRPALLYFTGCLCGKGSEAACCDHRKKNDRHQGRPDGRPAARKHDMPNDAASPNHQLHQQWIVLIGGHCSRSCSPRSRSCFPRSRSCSPAVTAASAPAARLQLADVVRH